MQVLLPPAQSGGSEASTRSQPSAPRRSIKAAEPKVEHRDAAVRARNARNQHLHRQRQKVSAKAFTGPTPPGNDSCMCCPMLAQALDPARRNGVKSAPTPPAPEGERRAAPLLAPNCANAIL